MKNKILTIALFMIVSLGASATNGTKTTTPPTDPKIVEMVQRVDEIKAMDFKELDRNEKKALKVELRSIEKQLKKEGLDTKVSISVGAIIIILLVLILI